VALRRAVSLVVAGATVREVEVASPASLRGQAETKLARPAPVVAAKPSLKPPRSPAKGPARSAARKVDCASQDHEGRRRAYVGSLAKWLGGEIPGAT